MDARCLLQSEIDAKAKSLAEAGKPLNQDLSEVRRSVLAPFGISDSAFWSPPLRDLVMSGARDLVKVSIPNGHVPSLSRAEADALSRQWGLSLPLHVSVAELRNRRAPQHMVVHKHPNRVPAAQYVHLADGLFVATPELALLQAAAILKRKAGEDALAELFTLMSEFFSVYVSDPTAPFQTLRRQALSTPARCRALLGRCQAKGLPGGALFAQALPYAIAPCASDAGD